MLHMELSGHELLRRPLLNKDTAFTDGERDAYRLRGLLPAQVTTLEQQVALELEHVRHKTDALEKYIGLTALQDRNETLFYRLLLDHIEELAPIVYTPTVGGACRHFSHLMRRPRGLWITPADVERIPSLLRNVERDDVRLIVVTDNERILGLGDQGAGGMGIPIGKLALYTAAGGVHPALTLPVSLDVGTDNRALLEDPLYLGHRAPRLRGAAYDEFLEAFVEAVLEVYPRALVQWEDFKQHVAIRLLDRYRHRLPSFNDDVQGTAATVLGGILAAIRETGARLADQRALFLGAGAAGIGIARLLRAAAEAEGASLAALVMLDSEGVLHEGRPDLAADKRPFALAADEVRRLGLRPCAVDLESVVRQLRPTLLIGTCGQAGAFTEGALRALGEVTAAPIVLPLSNPTSQCEAVPADVLAWTGGRAVVATGSPFEPVRVAGAERIVGQANNMFVFPGVGLGAIVAEARELTDGMFLRAARALAGQVSAERFRSGALYPPLTDLRRVSRAIAVAVATEARDAGVGRQLPDAALAAAVGAAMWEPVYSAEL
jgi:malate dehydrogenase (oxaloacetate-decarboxylating)